MIPIFMNQRLIIHHLIHFRTENDFLNPLSKLQRRFRFFYSGTRGIHSGDDGDSSVSWEGGLEDLSEFRITVGYVGSVEEKVSLLVESREDGRSQKELWNLLLLWIVRQRRNDFFQRQQTMTNASERELAKVLSSKTVSANSDLPFINKRPLTPPLRLTSSLFTPCQINQTQSTHRNSSVCTWAQSWSIRSLTSERHRRRGRRGSGS